MAEVKLEELAGDAFLLASNGTDPDYQVECCSSLLTYVSIIAQQRDDNDIVKLAGELMLHVDAARDDLCLDTTHRNAMKKIPRILAAIGPKLLSSKPPYIKLNHDKVFKPTKTNINVAGGKVDGSPN